MSKDIAPEPNDGVVAPTDSNVELPHGPTLRSSAPKGRLVLAGQLDKAVEGLVASVRSALELGASEAEAGASFAELEAAVGLRVFGIGQRVLAYVFAHACRIQMERDVQERGLSADEIRLRTDDAGYITMHTTFGPITFPIFAYRDFSSPLGSVTRSRGRILFPYHRKCRSSPLCLEWEARLGLQHPFRKAEEMLHFFTRGASTIEDTTIARHMLALHEMVKPEWLYRRPEEVRQTLQERATRDKDTGRPLLYVSSDAHALRRYVGDTWALQWKMVNGIRVWCEDAETGQVVHLGGEFTWGDCREVGRRFQALRKAGILPNDEPVWTEVDAQLVFVSDGSEWLVDHVVPLLVGTVVILDPYHLIDWFAQFTSLVFGVGSKPSRALHANLRRILFNKRSKAAEANSVRRRGHRKTRRAHRQHAHDKAWAQPGRPRTVSGDFTAEALLELLAGVEVKSRAHQDALDQLVERIAHNALRIDYAPYLARGYQIGSGAMESLHRTGSQLRLKLPGARWLENSSQAILHFRMLELSGRWEEFWRRADIVPRIAEAFESAPSRTASESVAEKAA